MMPRYWRELGDDEKIRPEDATVRPFDDSGPRLVRGPVEGCGLVPGSRERAAYKMAEILIDFEWEFIQDHPMEAADRLLAAALGEQETP